MTMSGGVAHDLVPDAGKPIERPDRQSRSQTSGSMPPSNAPRSHYGIRPYVQSTKGSADRGFARSAEIAFPRCARSHTIITRPFTISLAWPACSRAAEANWTQLALGRQIRLYVQSYPRVCR